MNQRNLLVLLPLPGDTSNSLNPSYSIYCFIKTFFMHNFSIQAVSVADQTGLSLTWSEIQKNRFSCGEARM